MNIGSDIRPIPKPVRLGDQVRDMLDHLDLQYRKAQAQGRPIQARIIRARYARLCRLIPPTLT